MFYKGFRSALGFLHSHIIPKLYILQLAYAQQPFILISGVVMGTF